VSARDPLPLVAQAIKNGLKKSDDHRVTVALRLAEAKSRVEAGEDAAELQRYVPQYRAPWDAWLALNEIKLSEREVRFLLAVAASPDPHRMVADERARARDGMRRLRAARKGEAERRNVTPEPAPVDNDWLEVGPADAHQGAAHVEAEIIEPEAMIKAPAMDEPVDAAVDEPAPVAVAMPAKTDTNLTPATTVEAEVEQIMAVWCKVSPAARKIAWDRLWEWDEPKAEKPTVAKPITDFLNAREPEHAEEIGEAEVVTETVQQQPVECDAGNVEGGKHDDATTTDQASEPEQSAGGSSAPDQASEPNRGLSDELMQRRRAAVVNRTMTLISQGMDSAAAETAAETWVNRYRRFRLPQPAPEAACAGAKTLREDAF
jgi:hypothetical protein